MRFAYVFLFAAACGSVSTSKPDAHVDSAGASCPALTDPMHGHVTTTGMAVGGTATYACDSGFDPSGPTTRTCQADGTWSGNAPLCQTCTALMKTINGSQSASVNYDANNAGNYLYADNSTRAYSNPTGQCGGTAPPCDITGWVGFDLSSLPSTAKITQIKFDIWMNTDLMGPNVHIQRSDLNNWTRTTPAAMFTRTVAEVSAPRDLTGLTTPLLQEWTIDGTTNDFSADVADKWLTLGVDNVNTAYSYAYFDGTDAGGAHIPYIVVSYCQ